MFCWLKRNWLVFFLLLISITSLYIMHTSPVRCVYCKYPLCFAILLTHRVSWWIEVVNFYVVQFFQVYFVVNSYCFWFRSISVYPPKHKSILLCYLLESLLFNVLHLVYDPPESYFYVWCEIGLKVYFFDVNVQLIFLVTLRLQQNPGNYRNCVLATILVRTNPHHSV